jgi:hypothetical protein
VPPLPIVFGAKWHHYLGLYLPLLCDYFRPFLPYPCDDQQLALTLLPENIPLTGVEVVAHLFSHYRPDSNEPIRLRCASRVEKPLPAIDLKRVYKQSLKASTCIRYGKMGASVITVDMSLNNIDDMFTNYRDGNFEAFMGDLQPESPHLGFKFVTSQQDKLEAIPVRVVGKNWRIERSLPRTITLGEFWKELGGSEITPRLLGVQLRNMDIALEKLEGFCHPDGFLYFTVCPSLLSQQKRIGP